MFKLKKCRIINVNALLFFMLIFFKFSGPDISLAGSSDQLEFYNPEKLHLVMGKSIFLKIPDYEAAKSQPGKNLFITIGDEKIADYKLVPGPKRLIHEGKKPKWLYIFGKAQGVTNMTLWQNDKLIKVYELMVTNDISLIKEKLHDILPAEKDIRVFATPNAITLSGLVSSTQNLSEALALTQAYSGDEMKVINLLRVAGVHQVMLEVKVAEMSRSVTDKLGINFNWLNDKGEFAVNLLGGLISGLEISDNKLSYDISQDAIGVFGINPGKNQVTGIIDVLKSNGLIKILAEPTLIALSGQTANFLAGGEFPIPKIDDEGNIGVEFKPFGIELSFLPTVLSENKIGIKVEPAVSEIDYTTSVTIGGSVIPGLSTRRASTMVELADGQSFAIAGLLKNNASETISRFPILGDIPVLGALFKSKYFQRQETELVIIITPRLVKPLDMAAQTLPTDFYIEPDDAEFYLWGLMGKSHKNIPHESGEIDGEFGHIFTQ